MLTVEEDRRDWELHSSQWMNIVFRPMPTRRNMVAAPGCLTFTSEVARTSCMEPPTSTFEMTHLTLLDSLDAAHTQKSSTNSASGSAVRSTFRKSTTVKTRRSSSTTRIGTGSEVATATL